MSEITRFTSIEKLVTELPESVQYLMDKGIKCIACGEPVWGTLEENAQLKGFKEAEINKFVDDLNQMVSRG